MKETKSYSISKKVVKEAYERVKKNKGTFGVDEQSIELFEKDLKRNLYKIWNRMSSGSYYPPAVREVSIPKQGGGERKLGIPTVGDRVAQMVSKIYLEPEIEQVFHKDSYGYRPNKSAKEAVGKARLQNGFSKRNIATFGANILHYSSNPVIPLIFGGPYNIQFHGIVTIKP